MDFETIIDSYHEIRRQCYELARNNNAELMGNDSWLRFALCEDDINLSLTSDGINCYGTAYTVQTGGSNEPFDFTIPLQLIKD